MANRRMISSETWEDDFFTSLDMLQRLIWIGIITTCADDQGRFQDNANLINAKVFPLDDIDKGKIEAALNRFATAGKLLRYEAKGKKLCQVIHWWKHQTPRWAAASNYPCPDRWTDRERYHAAGNVITERNWKSTGGFSTGYIADSIGESTTNDVKGDVKSDVNGDGDGEGTPAPAPDFKPSDPADRVWRKIKPKSLTIPPTLRQSVIPIIDAALSRNKYDETVTAEEGKKYFDVWCGRRNKDGKFYSPHSTGWVDWWAQGGIPDEAPPDNGNGRKPAPVDDELERLYQEGRNSGNAK